MCNVQACDLRFRCARHMINYVLTHKVEIQNQNAGLCNQFIPLYAEAEDELYAFYG